MDFPDVDYRPPPDSVIFREQELMTNLYNEQKANEGVQTSEEQDRPLVSEEDAEMMAENTGMEGKRDQDEDSGLGTEGEDEQADPRIKKCVMCGANAPKLHTMNVYLLSRFVSTHGMPLFSLLFSLLLFSFSFLFFSYLIFFFHFWVCY